MITAPPMQHISAGGLALLVHGVLLAALIFGMSWTSLPQLPVQADLWSELPDVRPPPEPVPELPEPIVELPAPVAEPEPPPPAPPQAEPRPTPAEIALEQETRLERERQRRVAQELAQAREAELHRQAEETRARIEAARAERERERAEAELRESGRRQMEEELARMQQERDAQAARAQASARAALLRERVVSEFQGRITEKILGNLYLPHTLVGNPVVEYRVDLLPNGEVARVRLVKSSGQPQYDEAVERAILKSSPLPLPPDRDTARAFREGLILKFRPAENGARAG